MKYLLHFLLFLCFVCPYNGNSQNKIYQEIKKLPITDSIKFVKIDSLLAKNLVEENFRDLEIVASKYTNWLIGKQKFGKAGETNQIAIDYHTGDSIKLQKRYFKGGQMTFKDGDFPESIGYFKKAIEIIDSNELAGRAYKELGRNYHALGDYYLAISYFETAENILFELKSYTQLTRGYLNSVAAYQEIGTPEALKKLDHNLKIGDSLISSNHLTINQKYLVKRAIGKYHYIDTKKRDTVQGLVAFKSALGYAMEMKDSVKIASTYTDMGTLFDASNLEKSDAYYKKSLDFNREKNKSGVAVVYANLGKNAAKKGSYKVAEEFLSVALKTMIGADLNFKTLSDTEKQKLFAEHSTDHNFWKIMAYVAEAKTLEYESSKDRNALQDALFYYKFTDEIFDYYTENVSGFGSKLQWRKDASQHYGRALKACYYAEDTKSAFFFMEKNKAILLTEAIDKQRTNRSFNLPQTVYQQEIELKVSLNELEKQASTDPKSIKLAKDILAKKERLNSYWDSISQLYPSYVPSRNITLSSKGVAQNSLRENEIIVEFHLAVDDETGIFTNNTNGYILLLEKEKTHLAEIPNIQQLKEGILLFTESLKAPFSTKDSPIAYHQLSHQLYLRLFPTKEIRTSLKDKKVTIVPDNYLSLVPFEALTTDVEEMTYLLQESEVSYLYSRSFLENNKKTTDIDMDFLGMAPVSFKNSSLAPLSQSENELEVIQEFYSGDVLLKDAATKRAFLERLETYKIIHLATHADAQDAKSPWIAFYDGKITLEELYQTQNNASLVVLSGCNTTLGKQETGEGVMSLARGFFYSGAQSVMSTLWSIDDKSTAIITQSFYKNLEEGQTKSEALRNAKLGYLETHSLSEASPYHWASFIMIGDNAPIPGGIPLWKYFLFGILGLMLVFVGFRFLKK